MKVFNRFMLCLAFFLIIDQESIGNTTLSDAFGYEAYVNVEKVSYKLEDNQLDLKCWLEKVKLGLGNLTDLLN